MTVYALGKEGAAPRRVTPDGVFLQAHIHPDGEFAVCWGAESGDPRLWVVRTDGSGIEAIGPENARHPVLDATGTRVVFALGEHSDPVEEMGPRALSGMPPHGAPTHIAVLDLGSGAVTQLTDGDSQDQRPCWSPDGSTIVFLRHGRLSRVSSAGGDVEELRGPSFAYRPWFSLDGTELFFIGIHDGHRRIHRMPATGGEATVLPNDDRGNTHGPFADLGGECLLVHSTREAEWWPYELPLDGSPMRRLDLPGMSACGHATRAQNGVLTFDGQTMND